MSSKQIFKNVGIYSYYSYDLDKSIAEHQKLVFDHFNMNLTQIKGSQNKSIEEKHKEHGDILTDIVRNTNHKYYLLFDVDTIPLNTNFIMKMSKEIYSDMLIGAMGCANHIDKNYVYAHPCCIAFSKDLYEDVGKPEFAFCENNDTAQLLTRLARKHRKCVKLWNITGCDEEIWEIKSLGIKFGWGTIYENCLYHQYHVSATEENKMSFIKKCEDILKA